MACHYSQVYLARYLIEHGADSTLKADCKGRQVDLLELIAMSDQSRKVLS